RQSSSPGRACTSAGVRTYFSSALLMGDSLAPGAPPGRGDGARGDVSGRWQHPHMDDSRAPESTAQILTVFFRAVEARANQAVRAHAGAFRQHLDVYLDTEA